MTIGEEHGSINKTNTTECKDFDIQRQVASLAFYNDPSDTYLQGLRIIYAEPANDSDIIIELGYVRHPDQILRTKTLNLDQNEDFFGFSTVANKAFSVENLELITWNHAKFIALKRSITIYESAIAKLESRIIKEESSLGVVVNLVKSDEGKSMRLDCEVPVPEVK